MELLLADAARPFAVALAVTGGLGVLEVLLLLGGLGGASQFLDGLLPVEVGADPGLGAQGSAFSAILGFFGIGQVPVLVIVVAFLTTFGIAGLAIQALAAGAAGFYLASSLASIPAVVIGCALTRQIALLLARLLPDVETDAVTAASLVGRVAMVTVGTARHDLPAQARVRDHKGHIHFVLVEPDQPDAVLPEGEAVLLVAQEGSVFRAIPPPSAALTG